MGCKPIYAIYTGIYCICIIIYFKDITCYNPTRPPMMNADAIEDELRDLKVVLNKLLAEKETLVLQTQLPNVKFF